MQTARTEPRRKPAQLEMIGGKSARQRVWEEIRENPECFECYRTAKRANVDTDSFLSYVKCLMAGGYVELIDNGRKRDQRTYKLIKNAGAEAPRLDSKGNEVKQGLGVECIWRTLRMMGVLDIALLYQHVTLAGVDIKEATVKRYICALRKAGYLQVIVKSTPHRQERFCLKPAMDTGPRAPQLQNVKTVYDPNLNKVMHCEDPQEAL